MGEHGEPPPSYRVARDPGPDPATRRLIWIAAGLGGALAVLIVVYSLGGRHGAGVPVIQAETGPIRIKPIDPGGMQVAGVGDDALAAEGNGQGKLVASTEAPDTANLRAEVRASQAAETARLDAADKAAPAVEAPQRVPPGSVPDGAEPAQASGGGTDEDAEQPTPPSSGRAAALPAVIPPPTGPASPPRGLAPDAHVEAVPPPPSVPTGVVQVQLAALGSDQAARAEWARLQRRLPGLLDARQPVVTQTERNGHVYYRLRTGGFGDTAAATAFCAELRSHGAACSVAAF